MAPPRATVCKVCGAERYERAGSAYSETHWREYNATAKQRCVESGVLSYSPEYQRVTAYRAEAARQGATEAEGWWCAMAAEARFQQHGRGSRWLVAFIAAELAALRAMPPRCQPEWQPPAETWELEETA